MNFNMKMFFKIFIILVCGPQCFQVKSNDDIVFDINITGEGVSKFPKNTVKYAIVLNGFLIDPYASNRFLLLNRLRNSVCIRYLSSNSQTKNIDRNLVLKIISQNKMLEFPIKTIPCFFTFSFDYPKKNAWTKAKSFTKLPDSEKRTIRATLNSMLHSYFKDDISSIIRTEKEFKFRTTSKRFLKDDASSDMSFYKAAFHGVNRAGIRLAKDYVIELNKKNNRVVNVYRKNGGPILTLISKHSMPFESDKYMEVTYFYNFIKIDDKWWIY